MNSHRFLNSTNNNHSRSKSTINNLFNSNFENKTLSLLQYRSKEENSQNPLKYINHHNNSKNSNSILQFSNRILRLPNLKREQSNSLMKDKMRSIEVNHNRTLFSNKTLYFIRNHNQNQKKRNDKSHQSLLESKQSFLSNTNSPKSNRKKRIRKVLQSTRNGKLSMVNPTMQLINNISQIYTQKKLSSSKQIESRNEKAAMPHKGINESTSNTFQIYKKFPMTQTADNKLWKNTNTTTTQLSIRQNILKAYRGKTKAGKNDKNMAKTNQDAFLIITSLYNMVDFNVFGIFDGHGSNGHLVSDFAKEYIKQALLKHKDLNAMNSIEDIYFKLIENNYALIHNLFKSTENNLFKETFDTNYSGTTAVILFQVGYHIICANIGDCRGILIEDNDKKNQSYQVTPLSFDQKPHQDNERKRIERAGGRVEQYSELGIKAGPFRVWFKREDYPGLAMSRTIGDSIVSAIGVVAVPDIVECEITASTRYIILATDGVWEFIDNTTAMNLTKLFYLNNNPEGLCSNLIHEATISWEKEDNVIDDITVVTLFFNS